MAPAANIGDNFGLFEPVHGAAFDIAGNRLQILHHSILSIKMMLDWLGNKHNDQKCIEVGQKLEGAVYDVVKNNITTKDTGGDKPLWNLLKKYLKALIFLGLLDTK